MDRGHARDARRRSSSSRGDCRRPCARWASGAIGSAIVAGMVLLVTLWFVSLPFSFADLWWQHHWGLGPFDVLAWLGSQWSTLAPEVVSVMAAIALLVGLAGRFRRWWLIAAPVIVVIAAFFAFVSGWLAAASSHPLHEPRLASDAPASRAWSTWPARRCASRTSRRGRSRRTHSPSGSARRRTSFSGTRSSTGASAAASRMSSSPTSSATCAACTSSRRSAGRR